MQSFGDERFCIECCDKLTTLQAWPFSKVSVDQWLSNFDEQDKPYARHMVSQFIYLNDQIVDAQFISAFQHLSNLINDPWKGRSAANVVWNNFISQCLIVPVQGENPSPADSGYIFARKARQILGIDEHQLVDLDGAITALRSARDIPIVFVDDFVGSGEQFIKTIKRKSNSHNNIGVSIESIIARNPDKRIYYCNVAMTEKGSTRIKEVYPKIILSTANLIDTDYSWTDPIGKMWPANQQKAGIGVIEKYSKRLGYNDDAGSEDDWRGFHCLSLGLAFEHSTPDASLPIFFTERQGWKPLVTRR